MNTSLFIVSVSSAKVSSMLWSIQHILQSEVLSFRCLIYEIIPAWRSLPNIIRGVSLKNMLWMSLSDFRGSSVSSFNIINVSTKNRLSNWKYLSVSTLKSSMVKLFVATSVVKPWHGWMDEVHWVLSSAFQISVFSSRVSRAKQREQCLSSALPLWHSFKGPCSTDGHCLGWECMEGYSQPVSAPAFGFISAPSQHFLNTLPPLLGNFSFSVSSVCHSNRASLKCFWKKIPDTFKTEPLTSIKLLTD